MGDDRVPDHLDDLGAGVGKLSDTHGRKRLFAAAITVFLAGSALCAFAGSMLMLAAFRAFQGIGAPAAS